MLGRTFARAVVALCFAWILSCSGDEPIATTRQAVLDGGGDMDAGGPPSEPGPPTEVVFADVDTHVIESSSNANYSTSEVVRVAGWPNTTHTLVRFDSEAIEDAVNGRHVAAAYVALTVHDNGEGFAGNNKPMNVHRMWHAWDVDRATFECASDSDLTSNSVNCGWNSPEDWFMGGPQLWPFVRVPTATVNVGNDTAGTLYWNVTNDVLGILFDLVPNQGWIFQEEHAGHIDFVSVNSSNTWARPRLLLYLEESGPDAGVPCVLQGFDKTCDGIDDDCDGEIDEAFVPEATACGGEGACESTGLTSCVDATIHDSCVPTSPCAATPDAILGVVGDTWASDWEHGELANTNFGEAPTIRIGRGLIFIDAEELEDVVDGRTVRLATLDLTTAAMDAFWKPDRVLEAHRLLVSSGEMLATGECPIDSDITDNGRDCAWNEGWSGSSWVSTASASHPASEGRWGTIHLDLTSDIQGLLDESIANKGWILYEQNENLGEIEFHSEEGSATLGPRISLWFEGSSCTPTGDDDDCDTVDDDCDENVDEDYEPQGTTCGMGACASTGITSCVGGDVLDSCDQGTPTGSDNDCNDIDEDCDGATDEGYADAPITCGIGACLSGGLRTCTDGATTDHCDPHVGGPDDAACDGLDEDCDGELDEDHEPVATLCGVGACLATGVGSCVSGAWSDDCEPGAPVGDDSVCNAIDDDCDGRVDESYVATAATCGVGVCAVSAPTACITGVVVDLCTPGVASVDDSDCDGWDDDCDEEVDEAFEAACDGTEWLTCDNGVLVTTACDDGDACNGEETCDATGCVAGTEPVLDDGNACTVDTCDNVFGITHRELRPGSSCDDGDACNGQEQCWTCEESENLLRNASFEQGLYLPNDTGQALPPLEWFSMYVTPDTYSNDGSYGLLPSAFGNFTGVEAADGERWVGAWSAAPEILAQELSAPLKPGRTYRLKAKMHQAIRSDLDNEGSYEITLSDYYGAQAPYPLPFGYPGGYPFPRLVVGSLGPTVEPSEGWVERTLEFVAPQGAESRLFLTFAPQGTYPSFPPASPHSYPGLDDLELVETCPAEEAGVVCRAVEAPLLDDSNPCTTDTCDAETGFSHALVTSGTACHGSGTCDTEGECSNHPPQITSTPQRWHFGPTSGTNAFFDTVTASDPDSGQTLTYTLVSGPSGMAINSTSGQLSMTVSASGWGLWPIQIRVTDNLGATAEQRYLFQILSNHGSGTFVEPQITSLPVTQAYVDEEYTYDVDAIDDTSLSLTFALEDAPDGMTIDDETGVVTWTPTEEQIGNHTITVSVTDPQSHSDSQTYTLQVARADEVSLIVSTPLTRAIADVDYLYAVLARDPEGDPITYSLVEGPSGMAIDSVTGHVTWLPGTEDEGDHAVTVRATSLDNHSDQAFTLTVVLPTAQHAPEFESTPPLTAVQRSAYEYVVEVSDDDEDPLVIAAVTLPVGATFDPLTSTVRWVPWLAQTGIGSFDLTVSDGFTTVHQTWNVTVTRANTAPWFITRPPFRGTFHWLQMHVGETFHYPSAGGDAEHDLMTYALISGPAGMTMDTTSGDVRWTPTLGQEGEHPVTLRVIDVHGAWNNQTFVMTVGTAPPPNQPPTLRSIPTLNVQSGQTLTYQVEATDAEDDAIVFSLEDGPSGMTLDDTTGVLEWVAGEIGSHMVTVRATDANDAFSEHTFGVVVEPDGDAPQLTLTASHTRIAPGGATLLIVEADDTAGIDSVLLTVDGVEWPLDENGEVVFTSEVVGAHVVIATATDGFGNMTTRSLMIGVVDALDVAAPIVSLDVEDTEQISFRRDVVGVVSDDNLLSYDLTLLRKGASEPERIRLATGYTEVDDATLGTVDATLLVNGYYVLRLRAEDVNGRVSSVERPIEIVGQAKVGVVTLSMVDLVVPTAGVTLALVRSYDSRVKQSGDFGHGWRLDVKAGSVQSNRPVGENYALYSYDTNGAGFELPCQRVNEQRPHYTLVRLSEQEWYVFRPVLGNTFALSGGCHAEVFYEQIDGTTDGAELFIQGDTEVRAFPTLRMAVETMPASTPIHLRNPYTETLFDPQSFLLELADGRAFLIDTQNGITLIEQADGSMVSINSNGMVGSRGGNIFFDRDSQGRIESVIGPNGRHVDYAYDAQGDLRRVTDILNKDTRFEYHPTIAHHLTRVLDDVGAVIGDLRYDSDGRLSEACDPLGACTRTLHNLDTGTETVLDALAHQTSYTYDLRGNVTSQTDPLGNTTSFEYDANDNVTRAEGPDGSVATYDYDSGNRLIQRVLPHEVGEDAADFTYDYGYDGDGNRTGVTLPSGASFAFAFDDSRLTSIEDGDDNVIESRTYGTGMTPTAVTNRFGTTSNIVTNTAGMIGSYTDPFGDTATITSNTLGVVTSRTEHGKTITVASDNAGRPTRYNFGDGKTVDVSYGGLHNEWTSLYGPTIGRIERTLNRRGQLTRWVDPNGDVHQRVYDGGGRVIREINPLGNETLYTYDAAGRLETITDDALDATTTFERDDAGRVIKVIDPLGNETETTYKLGGRIESTTNARGYTTSFDRTPNSASITDALDRTTTTHLSDYGLATGTTFSDESETSSSYAGTTRLDNAQSFPLGFTDESGREREYGYDSRSGLQQAADLAGNDWSYTYAPTIGSDISYDVESGAVSLNASDAYGFGEGGGSEYRDVGTLSDPHGSMSGAFGRALASVTSPLGEVTTYHRNTAGRLDLITYPDGGEREITYDSRGLPVTTVLPQGTSVFRTFDSAFRETRRLTSSGESRTMTYGPMDRVQTMTDATGETTYHYDTAGRFTGMTYPHGGSVMYTRDKLSRVTDVRVKTTAAAAELVTHYTYDENGNLETVTDPLSGVTTYVYDEVDRLVSRTLPNDVVTTYTYDDRDRVLSVVHTGLMSNVLASATYVRSPSGEPTKVTREDGSYVVLTYDDALRLETESYYDDEDNLLNAIEYEYDADGNRVGKVALVGGAEVYDYEDGFQLATVTKGSVVDEFEYDGGGRVTGIERGGVETTLQWNVDDKITRVLEDDVEVAEYAYDGAGRRVGSEIGGVSKRYLVAPNVGDGYETPQAVTESDGDLIAMYVFAGEHPIAKISAGGVIEYYLQDSMGSVIAKSDDAGEVSATVKYDSFGDVTGTSGSAVGASGVGGDFRLHGMWLDEVSGLYHVRARTYDAATGRFLSRDPVAGSARMPESLTPYVFCHQNGQLWVDPSGMFTIVQAMTTVTVVGIVASVALPSFVAYRNTTYGYKHGTDLSYKILNGVAGFGDGLSYGATASARDGINWLMDWDDPITHDSAYWGSVAAGVAFGLARGPVAAAVAPRAANPSLGSSISSAAGEVVNPAASLGMGRQAAHAAMRAIKDEGIAAIAATRTAFKGGFVELGTVVGWSEVGIHGAAGQARALAETMVTISGIYSKIPGIRAAGLTKDLAQRWATYYFKIAQANPVTATAGNANALARAHLMQVIADLL